MGGKYLTTVPAQLIDRSVLDEEMLRRAVTEGAELIRPAQMKSVALQEGGLQEILLNHEGGEKTIRARWVVVASGLNFRLGQLFRTVCDGLWLWLVLEIRECWRFVVPLGGKNSARVRSRCLTAPPRAAAALS